MYTDQFAFNRFDRLRSGIGRGFHRRHVAYDDCGHERIADLRQRPGQFHVRGFKHRVGAFHERDQAAGFQESNCLMCHKFIVG